jgi:hypothetical protein
MQAQLSEVPRETEARTYLASAPLPSSFYAGRDDLAEVRGQLVAALAGDAPLTVAMLALVAGMIAEAVAFHAADVGGPCTPCDLHPAALCDEHGSVLDLVDSLVVLAHDLGVEVSR